MEHLRNIIELEVYSLGNCLGCISTIKDAIRYYLRDEVECGRRQILDLIHEYVVDHGPFIPIYFNIGEDVVD